VRADLSIRPLIEEAALAEAVRRLAQRIAADFAETPPLIIPLLRGSFMFAADLLRALSKQGLAPHVDFLWLGSYGTGTQSSGVVTMHHDIGRDVTGMKVLLLDDILESGRTLAFAREYFLSRGAASVAIAVLLEKPGKRVVAIEADYVGFTIEDHFVVGYGLDYGDRYRELPYIAVV
jgi:hypoxanthine phosphoribosyltransferase